MNTKAMMTKTKMPPDWLAIELSYSKNTVNVVFIISFINIDEIEHELVFSNRTHKAELLSLFVETAAGNRIIPRHNLLIKPLSPGPDKHLLAVGDKLSYELNGKITSYGLEFPGALFDLDFNVVYNIYFKYKNVLSNNIKFIHS